MGGWVGGWVGTAVKERGGARGAPVAFVGRTLCVVCAAGAGSGLSTQFFLSKMAEGARVRVVPARTLTQSPAPSVRLHSHRACIQPSARPLSPCESQCSPRFGPTEAARAPLAHSPLRHPRRPSLPPPPRFPPLPSTPLRCFRWTCSTKTTACPSCGSLAATPPRTCTRRWRTRFPRFAPTCGTTPGGRTWCPCACTPRGP